MEEVFKGEKERKKIEDDGDLREPEILEDVREEMGEERVVKVEEKDLESDEADLERVERFMEKWVELVRERT